MFTGIELTPKGVALMAEYVAQVREISRHGIPLCRGPLRPYRRQLCIRLGKALEKYNMAWLEDMIPWQHTDL